jgi:hypothetical protein
MSGFVYSSSYERVVTRKLVSENIYPKSQLDQCKYSVRIKDEKNPEIEIDRQNLRRPKDALLNDVSQLR